MSTTVLVADDTPGVRRLTRRFLEPAGYEVVDAGNGKDAIAAAQEHGGVDLLITDLVMPDMDGFELATAVRHRYPDVRVLYTSGYADMSWTGTFLPKPFTAAELTQALSALT